MSTTTVATHTPLEAELLEALRKLLEMCDRAAFFGKATDEARAAIAKAAVHPIDCRCEQCLLEAFGPLDAMPPDIEEVREAALGDLGITE